MRVSFSRHDRGGSTATEMLLMISVLVIALISAGVLFIPGFAEGVLGLGEDVKTMLSTGAAGEDGGGGGGSSGGSMPSGGAGPDYGGDDGPLYGGGDGGGGYGDSGGGGSEGDDGGDSGDDTGDGDNGGEGEDDDEPPDCPYEYDANSDRWRDPETGQYVSGSDAAAAGC